VLALPMGHLQQLHGRYRRRLATITEWPRALALLRLRQQRADSLFDLLLTQEDVVGEEARLRRLEQPAELGRPHPYLVLEAVTQLDPQNQRSTAFVGVTPDDLLAAQRAAAESGRSIHLWAALPSLPGRDQIGERLREVGAEQLFESPAAALTQLLTAT
jgi:phosphoglycolate phosphatase-like HAD superfamily hydrolase